MRNGVEAAGLTGVLHAIARGRAALRNSPSVESVQDNELLFGETINVFESKEGWAWCQSTVDQYVGYIHTIEYCNPVAADHRVIALSTPLLTGPDIKRATRDMLPFNARVKVHERANGYVRIEPEGYIFEGHLAALDFRAPDWVSTAERFVGTPYVWGGKSHAGMDCSGLVQTAMAGSGISAPRDADMQESSLGTNCTKLPRQRGDLVFWNGHVGIMLDAERLLHANSFHMQVEIEPLAQAIERIAPVAGRVASIKRI
jgi:hypothetical protein